MGYTNSVSRRSKVKGRKSTEADINNIISFSGGKDSTAMLLMMLDRNEPIHSVIFYDTGWEFPGMLDHVDKVEKYIGMEITRLRARNVDEPVACIGFAVGEEWRTTSNDIANTKWPVRFPLIEYGISEKDAIEYCKAHGFDWGGLYEVFDRVSCFCCPLQGLAECRKLRKYYPHLWARMLEWDDQIENNRGFDHYMTVNDLERRFHFEDLGFSYKEIKRLSVIKTRKSVPFTYEEVV